MIQIDHFELSYMNFSNEVLSNLLQKVQKTGTCDSAHIYIRQLKIKTFQPLVAYLKHKTINNGRKRLHLLPSHYR